MHKRILVTGANGMLGVVLCERLKKDPMNEIIGVDRNDYDLMKTSRVVRMFKEIQPYEVYHLASAVGGIKYNIENKFDVLYMNTNINTNVIKLAHENNVNKLMFIGSTCMYPKNIHRPMCEDDFMTGKLEDTNDAYAISKIHGYYLCKSLYEQYGFNAITVSPTNLYGPHDNFNLNSGHFVPSIIHKIRLAKEKKINISLFGNGEAHRDILYSGDAADQMVWLMESYNNPLKIVNLSTRGYVKIKELVRMVCKFMEYDYNKITWDMDLKKNGMSSKITDVSYLESLGYKIFHDSEWIELQRTIKWFQKNYKYSEDLKVYIKK